MPTIYRRFDSQLQADAVPEAFRVVAGTEKEASGTVIASFTAAGRNVALGCPVAMRGGGRDETPRHRRFV